MGSFRFRLNDVREFSHSSWTVAADLDFVFHFRPEMANFYILIGSFTISLALKEWNGYPCSGVQRSNGFLPSNLLNLSPKQRHHLLETHLVVRRRPIRRRWTSFYSLFFQFKDIINYRNGFSILNLKPPCYIIL